MPHRYYKGDIVLVPMLVTKAEKHGAVQKLRLRHIDDYDARDVFTVSSVHVAHTGLSFPAMPDVRVRFRAAFFENVVSVPAKERFGKWWPDIENYARAANAGAQELPVIRGAWYAHSPGTMKYLLHIPLYACELSGKDAFGDGCDWIRTTDTFRPKLDTKCLDPDDPVRRVRIIVYSDEVEGIY